MVDGVHIMCFGDGGGRRAGGGDGSSDTLEDTRLI